MTQRLLNREAIELYNFKKLSKEWAIGDIGEFIIAKAAPLQLLQSVD